MFEGRRLPRAEKQLYRSVPMRHLTSVGTSHYSITSKWARVFVRLSTMMMI